MKLNSTIRILVLALLAFPFAWRLSHAQDPPKDPSKDSPHRIEIVAKRFEFSPSEITLKKGQPVILALTSKDVQHGLKLDEFNQVVKANKGQTSQVEFTPTETGTFTAQCAVFCGAGHGSMKLIVHVTE
jgi:cytochrome c oxidase subunit 2